MAQRLLRCAVREQPARPYVVPRVTQAAQDRLGIAVDRERLSHPEWKFPDELPSLEARRAGEIAAGPVARHRIVAVSETEEQVRFAGVLVGGGSELWHASATRHDMRGSRAANVS
jgi:hypothetical protein